MQSPTVTLDWPLRDLLAYSGSREDDSRTVLAGETFFVLAQAGPGRTFLSVILLYLDASGTHGASPVFILAGVAVHEEDPHHLQGRFAAPLSKLKRRRGTLLPPALSD